MEFSPLKGGYLGGRFTRKGWLEGLCWINSKFMSYLIGFNECIKYNFNYHNDQP